MKKLTLWTLKSFLPEKQYLISFLAKELNIDIQIDFHEEARFILKEDEQVLLNIPDVFFANQDESRGFLFFHLPKELKKVGEKDYIYTLNNEIDYIGDIFFCLTRWEEHQNHLNSDRFNRVEANQLFIYSSGLYQKPHVNEILDEIRNQLGEQGLGTSSSREYNVLLTHDIDQIYKYKNYYTWFKLLAGDLLKRRSFVWFWKDFIKGIQVLNKHLDPYQNFHQLSPLKKYNNPLKTIFFLLRKDALNSDYSWGELNGQFKDQHLGLHNAIGSVDNDYWDSEDMNQISHINGQEIKWSRYHYLAHHNLLKGNELIALGIDHESSMYDTKYPGFRCGICHEFPWFDLRNRKETSLMIHPISFMDMTKIHLNWSHEKVLGFLRSNVLLHKKHKGQFVLLWHNTSFYNWEFDDANGSKYQAYLDIILYPDNTI